MGGGVNIIFLYIWDRMKGETDEGEEEGREGERRRE